MIDIDSQSGFCFGVTRAIQRAEEELQKGGLYCLGDIVHNGEEVSRLANLGLITIDHDQLRNLHNAKAESRLRINIYHFCSFIRSSNTRIT